MDPTDSDLVERCLGGDRAALETLLTRHLPYVYNLAFRMVLSRADAEDVTQEIAIKIVTKLATFDPARSAFRTWLYRIVANHVINMRTRGHESSVPPLERYYAFTTDVPDEAPDSSPEGQRIATDLATGCAMGVLLCLEREQRVAFLLAVAFGVTDAEGAEILVTSRDAFRKLLSRARDRLRTAMNAHCGLIDEAAPCRCERKVPGLVRLGAYGRRPLAYVEDGAPRLADKIARFDRDIYPEYTRLVAGHPFYRSPELTEWLRALVHRPDFRELVDGD